MQTATPPLPYPQPPAMLCINQTLHTLHPTATSPSAVLAHLLSISTLSLQTHTHTHIHTRTPTHTHTHTHTQTQRHTHTAHTKEITGMSHHEQSCRLFLCMCVWKRTHTLTHKGISPRLIIHTHTQ